MKVLLAEDDRNIREGLHAILAAEGYQTVLAADGR
jgi:DNA-binding response OmpR family regulator